jgi:hypothetical protein
MISVLHFSSPAQHSYTVCSSIYLFAVLNALIMRLIISLHIFEANYYFSIFRVSCSVSFLRVAFEFSIRILTLGVYFLDCLIQESDLLKFVMFVHGWKEGKSRNTFIY